MLQLAESSLTGSLFRQILPKTERLVEEILSLPMSATHTAAEIDEVAAAVREFFGA